MFHSVSGGTPRSIMPHGDQTVDSPYEISDNYDEFSNGICGTQLFNPLRIGLDDYGDSLLPGSTDPVLSHPTFSPNFHPTYDEFNDEADSWIKKPIKSWGRMDIINWLNSEASRLGEICTELGGEKFSSVDGEKLAYFTEEDFINCDRKFGKILYERFRNRLLEDEERYQYSQSYINCENAHYEMQEQPDVQEIKNEISCFMSLDGKDGQPAPQLNINPMEFIGENHEVKQETESPPKKKRPGRPPCPRRKKKPEKLGRLWEFIRDLLKNKETCPSLIVWDNYEEGMFRFVHSDKVAKLWGTKKDNPEMNYEKLSRAMRYYYKSKVLQPVLGRRLVYKFGPTATGWRVDNPNFKQ